MRDFNARDEISRRIHHAEVPFGNEHLSSLVVQMIAPRAGKFDIISK